MNSTSRKVSQGQVPDVQLLELEAEFQRLDSAPYESDDHTDELVDAEHQIAHHMVNMRAVSLAGIVAKLRVADGFSNFVENAAQGLGYTADDLLASVLRDLEALAARERAASPG